MYPLEGATRGYVLLAARGLAVIDPISMELIEILHTEGIAQRGGHILGASNIPWAKAVNDDSWTEWGNRVGAPVETGMA